MSSANANTEAGDRQPAGRLGRQLGIALFWLLGVYVIGMSSASIIPALYFPDAAPKPPALVIEGCASKIAALEHELLAKVGSTLQRGEDSGLDRWLSGWDGRAIALDGGCGPLDSARKDLLELRDGIATLLSSYRSGPLRVQQRLNRALEQWPAHSAARPGN